MNPAQISIKDYTYSLPDDKIALHPLENRDQSKLLVYRQGHIQEDQFFNIADHIPQDSLLVFNNTKVINARVIFHKSTGAKIEVFCLEPAGEITEYSSVMNHCGSSRWKCLVGGAAKWKDELLEKQLSIDGQPGVLKARMLEKVTEAYIIEFTWEPSELNFATIIEAAGDVPLPPYIKRQTESSDTNRYQTIFARHEGSVAAPTAGLHFTPGVLDQLKQRKVSTASVTLHVGAGTFKPVKADTMQGHEMHSEYMEVTKDDIDRIRLKAGKIVAVGTTSLRTLETLYWLGAKALLDPSVDKLLLQQWEVYQDPLSTIDCTLEDALSALLQWMEAHQQERVFTQTQILIAPGYKFRVANMLVTNFHQPQSTLLLLVAAAIGNDWRKMYDHALKNNFRFLSYGDANLLYINS